MKLPCIVLLLTAGLSGSWAHAQAGNEAPRQLGGAPGAAPVPAATDPAGRPASADGHAGLEVPATSGPASRFWVGLKTGPVLGATDVAAHYPLLGRSYLLVDGQRRLALTEVRFYEDETGYFRRARPRGDFREATLRRVLPGRLSVYEPRTSLYRRLAMGSALLALGNPLAAASSAATPSPGPVYFAKDDGLVYPLSHGNLRRAISDSPGALTMEARAHRYEVANTASTVLGVGLLLGGLVRTIGHLGGVTRLGGGQSNGDLTLGMLGASVPLLVVPLVLKDKPAEHRRQAIELYNYAQRR
ncbi:hypothetical protein [Hymenobacter sp. B1770]|uniref:hypothetical protein n=1 Tax=Hymenobacter sp. B1770 TaxID=1718788 RepID=UPI003CF7410A